jgi:LPXTG-motif cell wall-anchored protein
MGDGIPVQVSDEKVETKVFDYAIPMEIAGQPARAKGNLTWVGSDESFPLAPFIGLALLAAVGTALLILRRRRAEVD